MYKFMIVLAALLVEFCRADEPIIPTENKVRTVIGHVDEHSLSSIGVALLNVSEAPAELKKELPIKIGCFVMSVIPDSPAQKSGLRVGQVIHQLSGNTIKDQEEFFVHMKKLKPNSEQTIGTYTSTTVKDRIVWKLGKTKLKPQRLRDILLGGCQVEIDEKNKITKYTPKGLPSVDSSSQVYLQVIELDGKVFPQLVYLYSGEKWLFVRKIFLDTTNGEEVYHTGDAVKRDHNSRVWEWYATEISEEEVNRTEKILGSKCTSIRFEGADFYRDHEVSLEEQARLSLMKSVYELRKKIAVQK